MDSDTGKLFIGGISWETMEERLREYFHKYGEVLQAVIMKDKVTGRPCGFGFIVFADPSILDPALQDKHSIDGRTVEAKQALSREEQHTSSRSGNLSGGRGMGGGEAMVVVIIHTEDRVDMVLVEGMVVALLVLLKVVVIKGPVQGTWVVAVMMPVVALVMQTPGGQIPRKSVLLELLELLR